MQHTHSLSLSIYIYTGTLSLKSTSQVSLYWPPLLTGCRHRAAAMFCMSGQLLAGPWASEMTKHEEPTTREQRRVGGGGGGMEQSTYRSIWSILEPRTIMPDVYGPAFYHIHLASCTTNTSHLWPPQRVLKHTTANTPCLLRPVARKQETITEEVLNKQYQKNFSADYERIVCCPNLQQTK